MRKLVWISVLFMSTLVACKDKQPPSDKVVDPAPLPAAVVPAPVAQPAAAPPRGGDAVAAPQVAAAPDPAVKRRPAKKSGRLPAKASAATVDPGSPLAQATVVSQPEPEAPVVAPANGRMVDEKPWANPDGAKGKSPTKPQLDPWSNDAPKANSRPMSNDKPYG